MARPAPDEQEDDERTPLWRRFAMDGLSGLGLGLVVALLSFAVVDVAVGENANVSVFASTVAATLGLSVLLVTLAGTIVGWLAESRARTGKRVSQLGVAVLLMSIGVVATVALLFATALVGASILKA